jgi:hypothetical protein
MNSVATVKLGILPLNDHRSYDEKVLDKFEPQDRVQAFNMYTCYVLWIVGILTLVPYYSYKYPMHAAVICLWTYVAENFTFIYGHLQVHMDFIEKPYEIQSSMAALSLVHHYQNVECYSEHWLPYRLMYLCAISNGVGNESFRKTRWFLCVLAFFYFFMEPTPFRLFALIYTTINYFPIGTYWILLGSFVAVPFANVELGFLVMGYLMLWVFTEALCHEWYHCPVEKRSQNFGLGCRLWCHFLSLLNVMSLDRHKTHHLHQKHQMDEVIEWTDMWTISPIENLAQWYYDKIALPTHVHGQTVMADGLLVVQHYVLWVFNPLVVVLLTYFFLHFEIHVETAVNNVHFGLVNFVPYGFMES